ncbi:MAG: hypothetical protein JWQ63_1911 [Mucilaginibacter sp.]|nr:hypothetical protein [Mucilaginibacter sp.]
METQTIYHIALVTHITGITMVAGTVLVDYMISKQFWKQFAIEKQKGLTVLEATSKLPILFGVGFLLLIISGVYMMYVTHGAFGEQIWFRIKFGLIILIIINGLAIGRRLGIKLRKNLSEETTGKVEMALFKIKGKMSLFHISQLAMFIIIFVLSVFKFS